MAWWEDTLTWGVAVGSACLKGRDVGEGQFEVMTGGFGARVGRSLSSGLGSFVEEMGCALQSEGAHARPVSRAPPFVLVPSPRSVLCRLSLSASLREWSLGEGGGG